MSARRVTEGPDVFTLVGAAPAAGDPAPDFACVTGTGPLVTVRLADTPALPRLFSVVPSIDTPVCDIQAQRFAAALVALGGRAAGYTVSIDSPYALARHAESACAGAGLVGLSDYRPERAFGHAWGVLVAETQELCRAVFVVDAAGLVRYAEIAPDLGEHPQYDAPLAVLHALAVG